MKLIKYLVPTLLLFQLAVFAQDSKAIKLTNYDPDSCKTVGLNPLVTVCLDHFTSSAKISKRLSIAIKNAIKELISSNPPDKS
tara:strand:- start:203 stop:451 length:249 start_codon:yes stop_codon:yes gene_type:complete